ncbi:hypothetical protein QR680_019304 [Steinernema hermaphroditum]|uniref:Uncharacterized protein n=1 Tax=Steinernema hermaphroditum TaxID=289476 RepID=A0AA39GNP3_9BILA|nr:hypothetical protein QR680_019304 [Steinernema hermaphroditum]
MARPQSSPDAFSGIFNCLPSSLNLPAASQEISCKLSSSLTHSSQRKEGQSKAGKPKSSSKISFRGFKLKIEGGWKKL